MIKVLIGDKEIEVNENISVQQYQRIKKEEIKIGKDPAELLAIYTGLELSEIKNAPKKKIDFVVNYLNSRVKSELEDEMVWTFTYDGVEYGLENEWDKLAWGAWQDLEIFAAENIEENIHMIMSVLYRPVIGYKKDVYILEPYNSETIKERAEIMKKVDVRYWYNCANFFFQIAKLYITDLNNSLRYKMRMSKMVTKVWMKLPSFLQEKLPLDFILPPAMQLQKKI